MKVEKAVQAKCKLEWFAKMKNSKQSFSQKINAAYY